MPRRTARHPQGRNEVKEPRSARLDEPDGGVASLRSGLLLANRRTVMSGPHQTRRRPHRARCLNRCGAPNLRAGVEGAEPFARSQCTHIG